MRNAVILSVALVIILFLTPAHRRAERGRGWHYDFEDVREGSLPAGWQVEATRRRGPLATWQVVRDNAAPSGKHVLALTRTNHTSGSTFNLCWSPYIDFDDGEISVMLRADAGEEDQGGGVIWRARNKDNYYIARYNPLEDNFRIYYVKNGDRRMLASARLHLPAHRWIRMRIVVDGNCFTGYLDDIKYLEVHDNTFPRPGGVGVWVKADGKTSFDELVVTTR